MGDAPDIIDVAVAQFTAQADGFSRSAIMNDDAALDALAALAGAAAEPAGGDLAGRSVLDVACGPGIVACDLARRGATVVGIDVTPTMVELAVRRASDLGVAPRTEFRTGTMERLPLPDATFDVVVSRYALHHAAAPAVVVAELLRVMRPGGAAVVVDFDATEDRQAAAAYDDAERRRDPSHVRNLTAAEQRALFVDAGCAVVASCHYRLAGDVDALLSRSHGDDHAGYRAAFEASIDGNGLGVGARRDGTRICFEFPIVGHRFERTTQRAG